MASIAFRPIEEKPVMRHLASSLAAIALVCAAAVPAAADSSTTRIETRPFYGAVITIEEGVRVYRPMPATRHMIVNPGGVTPLSLSHADVRVEEHNTNTNYNYHQDSGPAYGGAIGGFYPGPYGFHGKGHHGHGGRPAGGLSAPGGHR
jgi:hypothetical protein